MYRIMVEMCGVSFLAGYAITEADATELVEFGRECFPPDARVWYDMIPDALATPGEQQ